MSTRDSRSALQDERVERLASGIVATLWPNLEDAPRVADEIAAKIAPLVLAALSPAQADAVPADDEDATDFQCPNCKRYQYKAHGFECEECGTDCTPPAQADAASLPLVGERKQGVRGVAASPPLMQGFAPEPVPVSASGAIANARRG